MLSRIVNNVLYFALLLPILVFAADDKLVVPDFVKNTDATRTLNTIGQKGALLLYGIAGVVAVIGGIKAGMKWMDDDPEGGKLTLRNIVIGGSVIALVGAIVQITT